MKERIVKGHKVTWWGDSNVLYLECVCLYQISWYALGWSPFKICSELVMFFRLTCATKQKLMGWHRYTYGWFTLMFHRKPTEYGKAVIQLKLTWKNKNWWDDSSFPGTTGSTELRLFRLPRWLNDKELANARDSGSFHCWIRKIPQE